MLFGARVLYKSHTEIIMINDLGANHSMRISCIAVNRIAGINDNTLPDCCCVMLVQNAQ